MLCFTDPAGSFFLKIEKKNVKMLICTRNPVLTSLVPGLRAFVASSTNYFVLQATNARRPGNEAKYSPHGKNGGWRAVWYG